MKISDYSTKLTSLRAAMEKAGVAGFLIPRADEFQGENVPPCADRLRWMTGFTGSAGIAVILRGKAVVMSDGRYTIQLKQEVDGDLYERCDSTKISAGDWIVANAPKDSIIGYDPRLHTAAEIKKYAEKNIVLKAVENFVDAIWVDRPAPPSANIENFPMKFAGVESKEKLDIVAANIKAAGADAAMITMPDSIAWMLNIRSNDVAHTPVALSNAIVRGDGTMDWFIDGARVGADVQKTFGNRVSLVSPHDMEKSIAALKGKNILMDGRRSAQWFFDVLSASGASIIEGKDPAILAKARKNPAEIVAMKSAHIRDGVAVTKFLKWIAENKEPMDEISVEKKLEGFRSTAKEYRDNSFDTIAGFGGNGAIVHYRATKQTNAKIIDGNLLLLDSGAQYEDGTTDITRTIAIGTPTDEMREMFTLVLKGHIAVARARFKKGTLGKEIDALARAPLKARGFDYAHGTGHGVGCYLSVHEEAASLSPRGEESIEDGMIISNEPGFYKEGAFGIRIENLVLACDDNDEIFFETITLAPMDLTLVDFSILDDGEKNWLNDYHARVYETLSPLLENDVREWLKKYMNL